MLKTGNDNYPRKGEIYWVNLGPVVGSESAKTRPGIVVSNNIGNANSPRVIIAPITSKINKVYFFEVPITLKEKKGKILLDQVKSIDKKRLGNQIGFIDDQTIEMLDIALKVVFGSS